MIRAKPNKEGSIDRRETTRSEVARQISYKSDTISVPTPAGACCKYNEGEATAGYEIVVGVALLVDGAVEFIMFSRLTRRS